MSLILLNPRVQDEFHLFHIIGQECYVLFIERNWWLWTLLSYSKLQFIVLLIYLWINQVLPLTNYIIMGFLSLAWYSWYWRLEIFFINLKISLWLFFRTCSGHLYFGRVLLFDNSFFVLCFLIRATFFFTFISPKH